MKRLLLLIPLILAACAPAATDGLVEVTLPTAVVEAPKPTALPAVVVETAVAPTPLVEPTPESSVEESSPEPVEPAAEIIPTELPAPTQLPPTEAAPETAAIVAGVTDEGAYFYGSPDAPLTLIDYSDFL